MNIKSKYGLPFINVVLTHEGKTLHLENFLVDTGSASTLISAEIAVELGLGPEPNDVIREIRGVGGSEFVYEKSINNIQISSISISSFTIQVGDMDYGFEMDGIIGYNFLKTSKANIDLENMILK
jgi:predicted aspartyl protease